MILKSIFVIVDKCHELDQNLHVSVSLWLSASGPFIRAEDINQDRNQVVSRSKKKKEKKTT